MDVSCVLVINILGVLCGVLSGEEVRELTMEHWEGILKRTIDSFKDDGIYTDDAAHIVAYVDVQSYYRQIFAEGWEELGQEQSLTQLLHEITSDGRTLTNEQRQAVTTRVAYSNLRKPIPGRYIVMFHKEVDTNDVLDRTIDKLLQLHWISNQHVRVADISPFRNVRKGFIATMNSRAVELVSGIILYCGIAT